MNARQPRGYVMILVMLALLALSVLVAGFYASASDAASMARVVVGQQVAMMHADNGFQEAVRAVRARELDLTGITVPCTATEVDNGTCSTLFNSPTVNNGNTNGLASNGGLQYQYVIYRRPTSSDPGQPTNRYVIRSTGFYGYTATSANLVTSVVEAEIDIGSGNKFQCTNGYECQ